MVFVKEANAWLLALDEQCIYINLQQKFNCGAGKCDAYVQLRVRASTHMRTRMHLDVWKQGAIIICALKCIAVACIIFHHTPTLTPAAHWCKTLNLVLELMKKTYLLRMKAKKLADVCICKRVRFKKKGKKTNNNNYKDAGKATWNLEIWKIWWYEVWHFNLKMLVYAS